MRNLITTMALLALIGSPAAMAQTGSKTGSPGPQIRLRRAKPRSVTVSRARATFLTRKT